MHSFILSLCNILLIIVYLYEKRIEVKGKKDVDLDWNYYYIINIKSGITDKFSIVTILKNNII